MRLVIVIVATLVGCAPEPIGVIPCDDSDEVDKPAKHAHYKTLTGRVVRIADGDTLTILDESKTQHRIRLQGIDTPESKQAFGTKAREALAGKVFKKTVTVRWIEKGRYKRTLGHVYIGKRWINLEMVADGWAWHYKRYSKDKELAASEVKARKAKAGLWADQKAVPPWEFRRRGRSKK